MHTPATAAKTSYKNILLIEDEGEMCLLLNLLLNKDDMRIQHVKTLADALAFLEKKRPSLILLDNRLPDGFGCDLLPILKKNYPDIQIIMMSGIDLAAADCALEAGADDFLRKPFTRARLMTSINTVLN